MKRALVLTVCLGAALLIPPQVEARRHAARNTSERVEADSSRSKARAPLRKRVVRRARKVRKNIGKFFRRVKTRVATSRVAKQLRRIKVKTRKLTRKLGRKITRRPRLAKLRAAGKRFTRKVRRMVRNSPLGKWRARRRAARLARQRQRGISMVARVKPVSRLSYLKRSRKAVGRFRGKDRFRALKLLARGRRTHESRHAALAYLDLRAAHQGSKLPISFKDMGTILRSKGWTSRRVANFAMVLRQASVIARKEKIGARAAFDKALKVNGIYKKYYSGVCSG